MSTNCISCGYAPRTGNDLLCDACRAVDTEGKKHERTYNAGYAAGLTMARDHLRRLAKASRKAYGIHKPDYYDAAANEIEELLTPFVGRVRE